MMHTANNQADWTQVPSSRHNIWQKVASATGGYVTPGNIMTLTGLGLVAWGLHEVFIQNYLIGCLVIATGRIFDLLDGIIADYTGTKSHIGEIIDASADKIAIFLCAAMIALENLAPTYLIGTIVLINLVNIIISITAKLRRATIHPSLSGKLFMAFSWMSIITYLYSHHAEKLLLINIQILAILLFTISVLFGINAILGYYKNVFTDKQDDR